jgi:hypothetical protein
MRRIGTAVTLWSAVLWAAVACAGGPRFETGTNFWNGPGYVIAFYTPTPAYYTDPGDLSSNVTHAQADAMVAAAAATWNVSTSALVLRQGGELAEHVSGGSTGNVYFDGSEMVFPADVSASNYQTIPIAVIYDTDGSVIDALLGEGASDPSGCRDTGVVESVDSIGLEGAIHHALLILNGRCVGSTPQQLLQMQYQLERAFGRVVGVSWSQEPRRRPRARFSTGRSCTRSMCCAARTAISASRIRSSCAWMMWIRWRCCIRWGHGMWAARRRFRAEMR